MKNVLLIDIPTYKVPLNEFHKNILKERLLLQSFLWQTRTQVSKIRPSLSYTRGLLTIGSSLESRGNNVKYLNLTDPIDHKVIRKYVLEADVVGITVITPTSMITRALTKEIKSYNKNIKIVLGGPHIIALGKASLIECSNADYAYTGYCEATFSYLVENLENPDLTPNCIYKNKSGNIYTSTAISNGFSFRNSPLPAYHLLNRPLRNYSHNIRTMHGCPYKCNFCADGNTFTSFNLSCRFPKNLIKELSFLAKHLKPKTLVHFSDSIFNFSKERTEEIVDLMKHKKIDLIYSCDTRIDHICADQIKQMSNVGFRYLRMGFEDTNDKILGITKKSITYNKQIHACQTIRSNENKISIHAYMIAGLPGSTAESMFNKSNSIKHLIDEDLVDIVGNKIFVPYPGTPFYNNPEEFGINIKTKKWEKYDRRSYPVYDLKHLTSDEIYAGYLFQEATLLKAYKEKIKNKRIKTDLIEPIQDGLDYLYENYV